MKTIILAIFLICCHNPVYAQWPNPENQQLSNTLIDFMNNFGGGGLILDNTTPNDSNYYSNNTYAELGYAELFFQKRQINMYYRNLEEAQRRELNYLKKNKTLTIDEVKRIYNR